MKKLATTILLSAAAAVAANAQTSADALRYSVNDYYGTARTMAMGNAFTALGGDLGSLGINPAGSAVNSFSQVTISPSVSIVSTRASYLGEPSLSNAYGAAEHNSKARFTVPNFGFVLTHETGRRTGLKSFSWGLVANTTSYFLDNMATGGINGETSFAGSMAANVGNYASSALQGDNAYWNTDASWLSIVGWQSGMISNYGTSDKDYIGATEKLYADNTIQVPDKLSQKYGRQAHGRKYDVVLNYALNFSDKLFIGANVGFQSIDYSMNTYFKEAAMNPSSFEVEFDNGHGGTAKTNFDNLRYRYHYGASGTGIYGKFGAIFVPSQWVRIGAAIQTPTAVMLKENWQHAGDTYYSDYNYDAHATSPRGEYEYKLVSPFRFNAGVAFTFGPYAVLSADYEFCNYSQMKFMEKDTNDQTAFEEVNSYIKNCYYDDYATNTRYYGNGCGIAHSFRIGAEVKPTPEIAIRAGYGITSSPERYYENNVKKTPSTFKRSFAAGLGYSSDGSFFFDLAVRGTRNPVEYIYPYSDYIFDNNNNVISLTPEIRNKQMMWDVVATLGFRF